MLLFCGGDVSAQTKSKMTPILGLGCSFRKNSMSNFISSVSKIRLKLNCDGFCNNSLFESLVNWWSWYLARVR